MSGNRTFLSDRHNAGASYSTLNTTRSTLTLVRGNSIMKTDYVNRLLKGSFRLNPPTPKYDTTWDSSVVLNYLSDYYPYDNVSLNALSYKTVALIAIVSTQRISTLSLIKNNNITESNDSIVLKKILT